MNEFSSFFWLGFEHILNIRDISRIFEGGDHILFIMVLVAVYPLKDWRKIFILITAFTLGHSLTLALAAFEYIPVNKKAVELLIPITILLTALYNFIEKEETSPHKLWSLALRFRYAMAIFFGLIHGFAFSRVLRDMFSAIRPQGSPFARPAPEADSLVFKLFAFNVGIEIGQIMVVLFVLALAFVLIKYTFMSSKTWRRGLSSLAIIASLGIFVFKLFS